MRTNVLIQALKTGQNVQAGICSVGVAIYIAKIFTLEYIEFLQKKNVRQVVKGCNEFIYSITLL